MSKSFPVVTGNSDIPNETNVRLNRLEPLVETDRLSAAQPNFWDGNAPNDLDLKVRKSLTGYIVPSGKPNAPCLPNFFAEGKGPAGNSDICRRQTFYDGALGERAMNALMNYADPSEIYDYARTFVCTFHGVDATLAINCLYRSGIRAASSKIQKIHIHMHYLGAFAMIGSADTFRKGAIMFRNTRLLAKKHRDNMIEKANRKSAGKSYKSNSGSSLPAQTSVSFGSNASGSSNATVTDELSPEYEARKKARLEQGGEGR
ncbi:uncharacterized protein KY384_008008 [Bacidia gigantensis]|uniref:uncharacterized protein n=1 Tax=Bacidia gigantensis TaxID=2732470 RepID=UPI001D05AD07|nr:uncharacterized protein KY384_008008 [Bacidia gigantensis]KAG8527264.1 hypothetical protein KY384_008008 [Bacidia gigantensis]